MKCFTEQLRFFSIIVALFFLSACSAALLQPALPEEGMSLFSEDDSDVREDFKEGRTTVILDIDDQGQSLARQAELKVLLGSKIIGDLNAVGVDDLNRESEQKLIEEIKLVEATGKGYEGPVLGNYAVFVTFLESSFEVNYEKPFKLPFSDDEAYRKKPGTCAYAVTIHLGLKIKDLLASARTVKSINVKDTETDSFESTNQNCPVPGNAQKKLARQVTEEVARCLTLPLQQFLAPRGRITASRREEKGRTFFRLSTGKEGGIKIGDTVEIYSRNGEGQQVQNDKVLATAQVHKQIGANFSWLMVSDEAQADLVERGDVAKVSYKGKFKKSHDWFHCQSIRTES